MFTDEENVTMSDPMVDIRTDRWGVAHIRAASSAGVFYGQGYAAASSRLFQMELWRRRGLGRFAEIWGRAHLEADRAARTFLARTSADEEFAVLPDIARTALSAFVDGVNRRIGEVLSGQAPTPIEFTVAGFAPELWSIGDILRIRIHGLHGNLEEEVARATTLRDFGADIERLRRPLEPEITPRVPAGLDLDAVHAGVLNVYRAAHAPVDFAAASLPPTPAAPDGSNNWAVSGSRTRSGRPIMATDPHRIMTLPALRTVVHLSCPEFDAIGMNEPYLPGVAGGHNGALAYSFTIAPMDVEDLYVYELDPTDPDRYRYDGEWERVTIVTEQIEIAGEAPELLELRFTRHGPILHVDAAAHRAFALRAAWLEAGATPYLGTLALLESKNVDDATAALEYCASPGLNFVLADESGEIAWQVAGRAPVRPNWDGLLPVPGDGQFEWAGYRTAADLPGTRSPEAGWVRSANQYNLAEDPSWEGTTYSHEWYSGYRARRLADALASSDDWTIASTGELQNDYLSTSAVEVLADIATDLATAFEDPDAEFARTEITGWDRRMVHTSRPGAIFDRWLYGTLPPQLRRLAIELLPGVADPDGAWRVLTDRALATIGDPRVDIALMAELGVASTAATRRALIECTLGDAVRELRERAGGDSFTWGDSLVVHLRHPLSTMAGFPTGLGDTGRHAKNGSSDTVGLAFGAEGIQTLGAATRLVIDVGDWDSSIFVTMPGVDGDVESPHAADLFDTWLADGYVPLLYSPHAVDAVTENVVRLRMAEPSEKGPAS